MDEENNVQPMIKDGDSNRVVQNASDQLNKKLANKLKKKAGKQAAVKGKLAAAMGPVIFWGTVIMVALIIIIGIIMFFATMPGMVMEKLKSIGKAIAKAWNSWWGSDDTEYVEDSQIYEALDYLEEMGYDLKGFGFLTEYVGTESDGVVRGEDKNITEAKSDFIKTYLASDNYVYTIKNHNLVTDNGWQAFWQHVINFFGGSFDEQLTRGIIAIYKEGSKGLGDRGSFYQDTSAFNSDEISLDISTKKLTLKRGNNQAMEYDLDGWTGRYGMPVDFLMSVHVATMMPDLAYDMASSFDTEIVLILHEMDKGKVTAAFFTGESYITYEDMKEQASQSGWWIFRDDDDVTREEAQKAMIEYGIHSPDDCENDPHCSEDSSRTECCGVCEAYVQKILDELKKPHDEDFNYYVPYIESVKDHWYRDVFYAINDKNTAEYKEKTDEDKISFTQYDEEYELLMKERWTLYKTDEDGNFKLYALNSEGKYATNSSEIENFSEDMFEKDSETGYYLFKGSADEQQSVLQGKSEGLRYNVSKLAETIDTSDEKILEDLGWSDDYSGLWTAYEESGSQTTDWERIYPDDDDEVRSRIYTKITKPSEITQTGEGQRAQTNAQIKKMFLENRYFRYDGSKERAELITKLRTENEIEYGPLSEKDLAKTVESDSGKTYTAEDLSGQVTINQDSLNAFSMLENTHTLDSDYIYRDFKELIVELGYFNKEELTDEVPRLLAWLVPSTGCVGYPNRTIDKRENEYGTMIHSKGDIDVNKKNTLKSILDEMDEIGSYDPENPVFDGEQEEKQTAKKISDNLTTELGTDPKDLFDTSKTPVVDVNISNDDVLSKAKEIFEGMINAPDGIRFEYCVGHKPENCDTCSEACKSAKKHQSGSCSCSTFHCNHVTHDGRGCGYKNTFEEAIESPRLRNVCCAVFVGWVLRGLDVDIDTAMEAMGNTRAWRGAWSITRLCVEYLGAEIITEYDDLEPGDIMSYIDKSHVDILGEAKGDNFTIYGCGVVPDLGGTNKNPDLTRARFEEGTTIGLRFNGDGNKDSYVGYNGNEAVVSPVTGILLEYGTYNPNEKTGQDWDTIENVAYRVNVDLKYGPLAQNMTTEDDEEAIQFESKIVSDSVGYAKILVLNKEYYYNLEQSTDNRWKQNGKSLLKDNGTFAEELIDDDNSTADDKLNSKDESIKWSDIDQTIYGYKEFTERYEKAGIAGYVIFIDGFIAEKPDKDLSDVTSKLPYEDISDDERDQYRFTIEDDSSKISFRSVTENNFTDEDTQLESSYVRDKDNKLISISKTNKEVAENTVKENASTTMYISKEKSSYKPDEDLIYIKEGTIIGRTMTDKELLEAEYLRNGTEGTYDEIRNSEENNKVIGNYLRSIMRDLDQTPVENVENFMKIEEAVSQSYAEKIEITEEECRFIAGVCCAANTPAHNEGTTEEFEQAIAACAWAFRNRYEKTAEQLCSPWYFNNGGDPHAKDYLDRIKPIYFACSQDFGTNKKSAAEVNNVTGQAPVSYKVDATGVTYWANGPWEESLEIVQSVFDGTYEPIVKDSDSWKSSGTTDPGEFPGTPMDEVIQMPAGLGNRFFSYGGVHLDKYR